MRLLARREHARAELAQKLATHAESENEVRELLDELSEKGLLSDERYAGMRMHARAARFGNAKLAHELRLRGVAEDLVDSALAASGDELKRARDVRQRRFGDGPVPKESGERARQVRFLMNRGFSGEIIRRVLHGGFEDE